MIVLSIEVNEQLTQDETLFVNDREVILVRNNRVVARLTRGQIVELLRNVMLAQAGTASEPPGTAPGKQWDWKPF